MNAATQLQTPYYRRFELPWEVDEQERRRFRRILGAALALLLLASLTVALLPAPPLPTHADVPPRLARVLLQEQIKPPPPPVPPQTQVRPVPAARPVPVPQVDRVEQARRNAQKAGILQFQDQLADLRRDVKVEEGQTRNLTGAVGAESHAERSLIAARTGQASGGIVSADSSRGFGTGAGALTGHQVATVTAAIARSGSQDRAPVRSGSGGKAARSREEIELVFDRNKGAIYALYARALREHPELQGKLVLEFTIAPSGEVTMCHVVSSELHDEDLEARIVARVKSFRFESRDVEPITTTKPIDFFPA